MKNNKGFTLVEFLAVFVILALLLGIGVVSYQFIMGKIEKKYYETLEQELLLAGTDYYNNHREEKPVTGYGVVLIDELVGYKYIETLKDRSGRVCSPNNDSKVYIYRTDTGYDYEACLFCDADYPPSGNYCNGNILGQIIISAKKENANSEYNVLKMSYDNTSWSNENVVVTFGMNDKDVTKYVIVNASDNIEKVCNNITDNSCSMTFTSSGSYTVEAYNNQTVVGTKRSFHVRIDKDKPVCEFVSGPSVELINNSLTSTYELECTDDNLDSVGISTNNFSQTNENVVIVQNSTATNITDGYKYTITVVGNLDGETALKLNANVVKDKAGNGNLGIISNSVNSDVTAPVISYSLPSGTYDENKSVTVTVSDVGSINEIEYKLYKDGELVSSGNPTGATTSVSFDVSLDSDGIWEILVKARDIVGNYNNQDVNSEGYSYRKYIIETAEVCTEWVQVSANYDAGCVPVGDENTGTSYTTCTLQFNYTKSMYCGNDVKGNPITITRSSNYEYGTQSNALNACENYNLTCTAITGSISEPWCSASSSYRKVVYERTCE